MFVFFLIIAARAPRLYINASSILTLTLTLTQTGAIGGLRKGCSDGL